MVCNWTKLCVTSWDYKKVPCYVLVYGSYCKVLFSTRCTSLDLIQEISPSATVSCSLNEHPYRHKQTLSVGYAHQKRTFFKSQHDVIKGSLKLSLFNSSSVIHSEPLALHHSLYYYYYCLWWSQQTSLKLSSLFSITSSGIEVSAGSYFWHQLVFFWATFSP